MLIDQTSGAVRCTMCGNDLGGPTLVDDQGTARCKTCSARQEGYDAGYDTGLRNMFEAAIAGALDGGATEIELREWLNDTLEHGPMFLAMRTV